MKRLFCVVFALALAGAASAGEWHFEIVDSADRVGECTSVALDSSGNPHISYNGNADLKYARWDGAAWQIETVDSAGGSYTSLALDSSNRPHISYCGNSDLKYARWNGSSWQIETVDSAGDVGWFTSLALDDSDYPHISYWDSTNDDLKYARWNGSSWQIETVDSAGFVDRYTSLALDSSGYPHISYGYLDLMYARWNGSSWQVETVDTVGDVGLWTSLALDSSGRPHISYHDWTNGCLKYARWDGAAWQIETVDSSWSVGRYTSLALDSNDYPHISYHDWDNDDLKYARWNGSSWWIQTVGDVGWYTSLALDSSGNPHISYYDENNNNLKYAYWEGGPAVEDAEVSANTCDEGVLVGWTITGDAPASFTVLRSVGDNEPETVSGALPGTAASWLDADVEAGGEDRYWLEATEEDGMVSRFGPTEPVNFPGAARELTLSIYPSPASGLFTVDYTLPENGSITIALYDLSGRRVTTVLDGEMAAGRHDISYDTSALPPGVYLARLATDSGTLTRRVVIAR